MNIFYTKKRIILLVFLGIIFIVFWGVIIFYQISKTSTNITHGEIREFIGPKNILQKEIFSPEFVNGQQIIFYDLSSHSISLLNLNSNIEKILMNNVVSPSSPDDIKWSPTKNKAIIIQGESLIGLKYFVYDIANQKESLLDFTWAIPFWLDNDAQIAYFYYQDLIKSNSLFIADYEINNTQKVVDLPDDNYQAFWLSASKRVLLFPVSSGDAPAPAKFLKKVNIESKKLEDILLDKEIIDIKTSPKGDFAIFRLLQKDYTTRLGLYNFDSRELVDLGLSSILSKVNWSMNEDYIFIAVSHGGVEEKNDLYIIDAKTYEKRFIPLYLKGNFNITKILFSEKDPQNLYFISRNKFYSIKFIKSIKSFFIKE